MEIFIHLSGTSSDPLSLLIQFFGSDTSKVEPGGGGGSYDPGSTSSMCLSLVHHTPLQKRGVEDANNQGGIKG